MEDIEKRIQTHGLESFDRFYSIYRGFIRANEDPEFLGRVQLEVPQVYGEGTVHDYWAWSRGMYSGTGIGMFAIPNIGDMVWVSFEGGDPAYPVWEYGHFGHPKGKASDVPEDWDLDNKKPTSVFFQTTGGHRIELVGKAGEELIRIKNKHGWEIVMNSKGVSQIVDTGKKINLGTLDNAAEPALLGDKTEDALNEIKSLLDTMVNMLIAIVSGDTAPVASLASSTGVTLTYTAVIAASLPGFNVTLGQIIAKIALIKSQKVRLD